MNKLYDLFLSHQHEEARALQVKANNIMNALCDVGLIPAIKYILSDMGVPVGIPRRPFRDLTQSQKEMLDRVLRDNLVKES